MQQPTGVCRWAANNKARPTYRALWAQLTKIDLNGIITIVNWDKYQYSDYDRQKRYRQKPDEDIPDPDTTDWEAEARRLTKELELVIPFTAEEARGYTADLQREALGVPIDMTRVKQD